MIRHRLMYRLRQLQQLRQTMRKRHRGSTCDAVRRRPMPVSFQQLQPRRSLSSLSVRYCGARRQQTETRLQQRPNSIREVNECH